MMDAVHSDDTSVFSDERVQLAAGNYETQEWLFRELYKAFRMSGMSIDDLAAELELPSADAADWIGGEIDLTMSELRQLANAVDAKIKYSVHAIRTRYAGRIEAMHGGTGWLSTAEPWAPARIER